MSQSEKRPVVIHAGFHKTGTTTVQTVLKTQHQRLAPHLCVILKSDIPALCQAALSYSAAPSDDRLGVFRTEAAACFGTPTPDDKRPVLISAEDLCGMFPGRAAAAGYPQAKSLLAALVGEFADDCAPQIYLSTRATQPWLQSCYAHNLRHSRMRLSFDEFAASQEGTLLQDVADDIASGLHGVRVTTTTLEDSSGQPEGPLTPLLDLFNLPAGLRRHLQPTEIANRSLPPDIQAAFLLLNRQEDNGAARSAAKKQLIADHRSGQQ